MSLLKESQHLKIPLKEIEIATDNFQECIGKGGYGMVYKGKLSIFGKSTIVAVKRLNEQLGQGLKEFLIEIQLLTGQKHPNLITLLGYCDEGKEKIIVYEYAEHGSLDQYLSRSNTVRALTWLERLKICVDAARGLNHLHNHVGKHQTIIHRDIKSANILIDHNWVAKISDLGLSKLSLAGLNRSAVISHACGTHGYIEPESISTGIVKKESDVYSFGMVLFEVLCGRLCLTTGDDDLSFSAPLAKDYYKKKKLDEIVDLGLREQMSLEVMHKFSTIAYKCLQDDREQRPPMDLVVMKLEELLEIQIDPNTSVASSSSSSSRSWKYDVFLSFRGEDTRTIFVDHLYSALNQRLIRTYKDDETLPWGDTISPSLLNAIDDSQIALIIFSENYANSSWCLDELEHIMKCKKERGQIVIPIFYHVDPSEVRRQKYKYEEAFAKYESENNNKVESWRKALVDASNISGWDIRHIANGNEAKGIEVIVGTILDKFLD